MSILNSAKGHLFEYAVVILAIASIAYLFHIGSVTWSLSLLMIFGFLLAVMDTAIGMGFGTVGTPVMLILGFSSIIAVPAVLIAQACSSVFGSVIHRRFKHVDILDLKGKDAKLALFMAGVGIIGAVVGVTLALQVSKIYVNTYIGLLVIAMGAILITRPAVSFSWLKLTIINLIAGFNKAISGGGYGPVAMAGQIVSGNDIKNSVGITIFAVAAINIVGFLLYVAFNSVSSYTIPLALTVGAILGSQIGPRITRRIHKNDAKVNTAFGILVILLGALTIIVTFVKI